MKDALNTSRLRFRRATILAAIAVALLISGRLTVSVAAQGSCAPFACFEAGTEGSIWQSLTPWGQANDPLTCTNSDPNSPLLAVQQDRVCNGQPPPLGSFLYPFAIAIDGQKIFVTDQFNHRVQAFLFDGTVVPMATPIGDGTYGNGVNQLNGPEGIAIVQDAQGNHVVVVADAYNGRLAFFNAVDGTPAFGVHLSLLDGSTTPTGIAVSPGTTVLGLGVPAGTDAHRIIVTDRLNCYVYILDAGLNVVGQIPSAPPDSNDPQLAPFVVGQGACVAPSIDQNTLQTVLPPVGYFGSATGVAIDASGHIFVADYDNSRVQILDAAGAPLGSFGTPPDPSTLPPNAPPPPGTLQYPWAVTIDHLGRIVVTDSDNERIAFFTADFSGPAPAVTFQFQLNAAGSLNGNPTGIAEQVGADTDPAGRIVVTDTLNQRIQRFQLPDLAIADVTIDSTSVPASGTFGVVVPAQKAAPVLNVIPSIQGVNASILTGPTAQPPADTLSQIDIAPGQIVTYGFTYNATGTPVSFTIDAVGNNGATHAQQVSVAPTTPCTDCSSTAAVLRSSDLTPAPLSNGWYNTPIAVRITATSTNPSGLGAIAYQFTSGPEVRLYGGAAHVVAVPPTGGSTDVLVAQNGTSTMQYWAVNADGSVEQPRHTLNLYVDLLPPLPIFSVPHATGHDASGAPWNNAAVTVSLAWLDDTSGPTTPNSTLLFASEGRNQFQSVSGTDRAGNTSLVFRSDDGNVGGRPINIDTLPPQFSGVPASVTLELTGSGVGALTAGSAADTLFHSWAHTPSLIAADQLLSDNTPGSGVVNIGVPSTGTTFPMVGAGPTTTPLTVSATDGAGNVATATINVIVQDTTKPSLSCPPSLSLSLSGALGVVTVPVPNVLPLVNASDLSGSVTLNQSPLAASQAFGLGSSNVTVTAIDPSGNANSCVIAVNVSDTTPPVITVPAPVSVPAPGPAGAAVMYSVSAADNVGGAAWPVTCVPASGSTFPIGTTPVNCSSTDAAGNTSTQSFTVTVTDNGPYITVPAPLTVEAAGPSGASAIFSATWVDLVDGSGAASCSPSSGSTFALGTATVTCSYTNTRGHTASDAFIVTVGDTTPPVITTPSPTAEATSSAGAVVSFTVSAVDLVSGSVAVSCAAPSDSTFAIGNSTVTCSATDAAGNTARKSFTVVVSDTTPPVLTLPAPVAEATGPSGATVSYFATGNDSASNPVIVACAPAPGSTFPLGPTTVNCTGTDARGNSTTGSFVVTVQDTTPPAVTVPANFTVGATTGSGANVTYAATAVDVVDGPRSLTCVPASGTLFPIGTTPVTCSGAVDTRGNAAPARTFQVTVTNLPPKLTQANIVTTATSAAGAAVTFAPQVVDASDPNPVVTCSPASGSTFPIGTTTVTCTATNILHLTGSVTFTVTVNHSAPVCDNAAPSIGVLWPPNHRLVPISINGLTTADHGTISTAITSVFQDEPTSGLGDGDTPIDGFGVGASVAQVRAERSGKLDGRFYYIGYTATTPGGSCSGAVTVVVPHDQAHMAVGQGPLFNSTTLSSPPNHGDDHDPDDHSKSEHSKDDDRERNDRR